MSVIRRVFVVKVQIKYEVKTDYAYYCILLLFECFIFTTIEISYHDTKTCHVNMPMQDYNQRVITPLTDGFFADSCASSLWRPPVHL